MTRWLAAVAAMLIACTPAPEQPVESKAAKAAFEAIAIPAGTGAGQPFLFTTRDGVGLSWLEPVSDSDGVALRVSIHRNGAWSSPVTVVERDDLFVNWADFPSVVEDADGNLFAHWLQKSGEGTYAYDVRMAVSRDGGKAWGESFLLNRDGRESEHGFVTLAALPGGGVGAAWLDGRHMMMSGGDHEGHHMGDMTLRYAKVNADGMLIVDEQLDDRTCECCQTGMVMTAGGPVIVYRDRSAEEIRDIALIHRDAAGWTAPRTIRDDGWKIDGCPVNGPQIDAVGDRAAVAWFTAANETQHVFVAFSDDGGRTFAEPVRIDEGKPAGRVDIVMLDENTALVSWLEQTPAGAEIRVRRVERGGTMQQSMKVADSAAARSSGFARMARSGDSVWIAWVTGSGIQVARWIS